ncbi:hypothetical protein [Paenibacillus sp. SYP-B3998]|uniref:hypothetical protein n=1 Tax=Paenibacillus sp. SYP-B3998 TaxID=2678564 RepID=UPI00196783EB|nr:hypothetical protein [Paenibacillus sp. SYP-B3998]
MLTIKHAEVVRFTERNDIACADVEVKVDHSKGILLAVFTASKDNDFDMTHVYRKDVSGEIDRYDNNVHQALEDMSEALFQNEAEETKWGEREAFKEQVLTFGSIRKELEEHFELSRKASLFHTEDVEDQTFLH